MEKRIILHLQTKYPDIQLKHVRMGAYSKGEYKTQIGGVWYKDKLLLAKEDVELIITSTKTI